MGPREAAASEVEIIRRISFLLKKVCGWGYLLLAGAAAPAPRISGYAGVRERRDSGQVRSPLKESLLPAGRVAPNQPNLRKTFSFFPTSNTIVCFYVRAHSVSLAGVDESPQLAKSISRLRRIGAVEFVPRSTLRR